MSNTNEEIVKSTKDDSVVDEQATPVAEEPAKKGN